MRSREPVGGESYWVKGWLRVRRALRVQEPGLTAPKPHADQLLESKKRGDLQ